MRPLTCITHRPSAAHHQLARIYREVKEGLATNSYVPAALYSCEEHLVGPSLASLEQAVQLAAGQPRSAGSESA